MPNSRSFPPIAATTLHAADAVLAPDSPCRSLANGMETIFVRRQSERAVEGGLLEAIRFLQLSVVTVLQWVDWLTDLQAANATQVRVDWKYCLHLPLNHPGFQAPELCLFRQQFLTDPAAAQEFQAILEEVSAPRFWPGSEGRRCQGGEMIRSLCLLNQHLWIEEAMTHALEGLAALNPEWLRQIALPHWYARYTTAREGRSRLPEREALEPSARVVESDIAHMVTRLGELESPPLPQLQEIRRLRRVLTASGAVEWPSGVAGAACSTCVLGSCIADGCTGDHFTGRT